MTSHGRRWPATTAVFDLNLKFQPKQLWKLKDDNWQVLFRIPVGFFKSLIQGGRLVGINTSWVLRFSIALIHQGNTTPPAHPTCTARKSVGLAEDVFWEIVKQCSATKSTNLSALTNHGHMVVCCSTTFDLSLRCPATYEFPFPLQIILPCTLRSPKGVCFYLVFPGTQLVKGTHVRIIADRHWMRKQSLIRLVYQHVFSVPFFN